MYNISPPEIGRFAEFSNKKMYIDVNSIVIFNTQAFGNVEHFSLMKIELCTIKFQTKFL